MTTPPLVWTEERKAILRRDWPTTRPTSEIHADLCALPGPAPMWDSVAVKAADLGLRRPAGYTSPRKNRVAVPGPRKARTISKPEVAAKPVIQCRRCLLCSQGFDSDGSGNRICDICKASPSWKAGISEHGVRA